MKENGRRLRHVNEPTTGGGHPYRIQMAGFFHAENPLLMESIHYVVLGQVLLSLILAFYLTRKFRDFIRATVVRFMPVRHRISDESFNMQTRISTIVAFGLGLLLTGLFYRGLQEIVEAAWPGAISREETTQVYVEPAIPQRMVPEPADDIPAEDVQPKTSLPEANTEPVPSDYEVQQPIVPTRRVVVPESGPYYLQLYAFNNVDRALAQEAIYRDQLPYPVEVRKISRTIGPYKVVVGPIATRQELRELRRKLRMPTMVLRGD